MLTPAFGVYRMNAQLLEPVIDTGKKEGASVMLRTYCPSRAEPLNAHLARI